MAHNDFPLHSVLVQYVSSWHNTKKIVGQFLHTFRNPQSAVVWLAFANIKRSLNVTVPEDFRIPIDYEKQFRTLGLVLVPALTHHTYCIQKLSVFQAIQRVLRKTCDDVAVDTRPTRIANGHPVAEQQIYDLKLQLSHYKRKIDEMTKESKTMRTVEGRLRKRLKVAEEGVKQSTAEVSSEPPHPDAATSVAMAIVGS
eukprot:436580_1